MIKRILFFIIITWVALMGLSSAAKAEGLIEEIMYNIIINMVVFNLLLCNNPT